VKKIYVGNFSFNMTESELRSMFESYGSVESATVATDRDTGRSRGFGFVSMPNDEEAEKAMAALNGKDFLAEVHEDDIHGETVQPGRKCRFTTKRGNLAIELQEGFLGEVFRLGIITAHTKT